MISFEEWSNRQKRNTESGNTPQAKPAGEKTISFEEWSNQKAGVNAQKQQTPALQLPVPQPTTPQPPAPQPQLTQQNDVSTPQAPPQADLSKRYIAEADEIEKVNEKLAKNIADMKQGLTRAKGYPNSEAIQQKYDQMQAEYEANNAKIAELYQKSKQAKGDYYASLPGREDYTAMSAAEASKLGIDYMKFWKPWGDKGDDVYDFINNISSDKTGGQNLGFRDYLQYTSVEPQANDKYKEYKPYSYMSEDEIGVYNYLYATEGKNAAGEYLSEIMNTLNHRMGTENYEKLSGAGKALYWLPAGTDQFASGVKQLFTEKAIPTSPTQYTSGMVRQEAGDISPVLGFAYDLGTVAANMAPSILLSGVTAGLLGGVGVAAGAASATAGIAGSASMGLSAGGNAYTQKVNEGYTPSQARSYASLVGLSEGALQYLLGGVSKLGGVSAGKVAGKIAGIDNALGRVALTMGTKMGAEGLEESLQELLEPAFATLILGEDYEVHFEDVAYSFLLGALTAGIIEGGNAVRSGVKRFDANMIGYKTADGTDYFADCDTFEQVEQRYKMLVKENHPDIGGGTDVMAQINRQHDMQKAFHQGREMGQAKTLDLPAAPETRAQQTANPPQTVGQNAIVMEDAQTPAEPDAANDARALTKPLAVQGGGSQPISTTRPMPIEPAGSLPSTPEQTLIPEQNINGGTDNVRTTDAGTQPAITQPTAATDAAITTDTPAGNSIHDGNAGRVSGIRAGEQAASMAGSPAPSIRPDQRRTARMRQDSIGDLQITPVSTRDMGFANGNDNKVIKIVPREKYDEAMQNTEHRLSNAGYQVIYFMGEMKLTGANGEFRVNGAYQGRKVYIQADHLRWSIDQIGSHEEFHAKAALDTGLMDRIEQKIIARFSKDEFESVVKLYIEKLSGIIDVPINGSEAEINEVMHRIKEEIFADAYGGKNAFTDKTAQYTKTVRSETQQRSVEQYAEDTPVRGPPAERFSAMYRNPAGSFAAFYDFVHDNRGNPAENNKSFYQQVLDDGSTIDIPFESVLHVEDGHALTPDEYESIFDSLGNIQTAAIDKDVKPTYNGTPVKIKTSTPHGTAGVLVEYLPKRTMLRTAFFGTDNGIDSWMNKGAPIALLADNSSTAFSMANSLTIDSIRDLLPNSNTKFSVEDTEPRGLSLPTLDDAETEPHSPSDGDDTLSFADEVARQLGMTQTRDVGDVRFSAEDQVLTEETDAAPDNDTETLPESGVDKPGDSEDAIRSDAPEHETEFTPAMQKLGIRIEGSVGDYRFVESIAENDRAITQIREDTRKLEQKLRPKKAEKVFAHGIAAETYNEADIPATMDKFIVMELAEQYFIERAFAPDRIRRRRNAISHGLAQTMEELFRDSDEFKPSGAMVLNGRTPERNMRKIFGDKRGGKINAAIFDPVNANEAERYRFKNRMYDAVRTFTDGEGKKTKLSKEERAIVQQVIEGRGIAEIVAGMEMSASIKDAAHNIQNGWDTSDAATEFRLSRDEEKLAEKYSRWLNTKKMLESGNVDSVKVENAAGKYAEMFDMFYKAINDFLVAHGQKPIGFIKGYAPHIQPESNQSMLNHALGAMGINPDVTRLPSSIAGLTGEYKPSKRWNPHFLKRTSDETEYDIASAFESYVDYMSDVLYHTDDIMRIRAAANYFRRTYAPEEIRENLSWAEELRYGNPEGKADFLRQNEALSDASELTPEDVNDAMDNYVDKLYDDIQKTTKYSDFVPYLDNYANILAGKQSMADRSWEYASGRMALNFGNRLVRVFARAQVAGSLSSALNQAAQLPQIYAELGTKHTAAAIADIASGRLRRAAWAEESDFLTGKKGINYLVTDTKDMIVSGLFKPAEFVDGFLSTVTVRGRYLKEIAAGKSHKEAMKTADAFGRSVMGSRMKGSKPLTFEAKNPILQMLNIFQLEALNSWEHISRDLPQDFRRIEQEKGRGAAGRAIAGVIVKMLLGVFLLNRLLEELYGGTPAPYDIIGLSSGFIASGKGLSTNDWLRTVIDNGWEKITGERLFGTEPEAQGGDFDWGSASADTGYNIMNDIPYVRNASGLMGLGDETLPLPDISGAIAGMWDAAYNDGLVSPETGKALIDAVTEFLPGGRQIQKTTQGLETAMRGGRYKGYGENARLQYPIKGTWQEWMQAMMFGNSGLSETASYYASGRSGLSKNQTALYDALVEDGADRMEVYHAIQAYRYAGKQRDEAESEELTSYEKGVREREAIRNADITDEQKLSLWNGLKTGSDKRAEQFSLLMDAGLTWEEIMAAYDEYAKLNADGDLRPAQKAAALALWTDKQTFTKKQAADIKDYFAYYSIVPAEAMRYESMTEAGLTSEDAYDLANALASLRPLSGRNAVTDVQRYRTIDGAKLTDAEKIAAMGTIMGTEMETASGNPSQYAKMLAIIDSGVSISGYLDLKENGTVDAYFKKLQSNDTALPSLAPPSLTLPSLTGDDTLLSMPPPLSLPRLTD